MSKIIAGLYEVEGKIGSGGGGVVYLGKHLRLNKKIILKVDKRSLSTSEEKLRREVDLLKNLSHTYIPQVYDFVAKNGVVCTVMDYIEGESLDKMLARGQHATQPQIVKWACQLLEALVYLHEQEPHGILHGDIKPANIMLKPNGDICLIDFNIALELGEEGAVKVGFSRGYASPEHYGMDYVIRNKAAAGSLFRTTRISHSRTEEDAEKTEVMGYSTLDGPVTERIEPEKSAENGRKSGGTTEESKEILLDVRSDIYSLGATLYHLISGRRPVQDARDIIPLGSDICSEAVSAILQKAMAPQPYDRYQTAEEMLTAFYQLPLRDVRTVRHKRRMLAAAVTLTSLFLAGGICTFIGLKQMENRQTALTLAEYSANALAKGDTFTAVGQALQAIPGGKSILEAPVTAEAQKALTNALGVYNLADGFKAIDTIDLPAAPFDIVMSPEGKRMAIIYAYEMAVYDLESRRQMVCLSVQESALSDCVFIDESHIVYAGKDGVTGYDLETGQAVWTGEIATTLAISADKKVVAAVNRSEDSVVIYDTGTGERRAMRSFDGLHLTVAVNDIFADAQNDIFALNEDGSLLAVSFSQGGMMILNLDDPQEDLIVYDESEYTYFEGGFCGKYFAFAAQRSGESQFGLVDVREAAYAGGYTTADRMILQADAHGICLASGSLLVRVDSDTYEEIEIAYTQDVRITGFSAGEQYALVATDDNAFAFYDSATNRMSIEHCEENCEFVRLSGDYAAVANRSEPSVRILKLEEHKESQFLAYDARYQHDEARVSQDGKTIMLFWHRGFQIYDREGILQAQVELPDAEQVYDQQFRKGAEDSWLEVTWYDGMVRCYGAADGRLLSEEQKEAPQKDLYEEFFTDQYRFASSLHGAPEVYDIDSGRLIMTLTGDDYLTYVTQIGDYIITEYVRSTGERYGLLLDEKLQELAYLPGLCDVTDNDMLIFDYESGNLRQCRLYSLQELIALGESYKNIQ